MPTHSQQARQLIADNDIPTYDHTTSDDPIATAVEFAAGASRRRHRPRRNHHRADANRSAPDELPDSVLETLHGRLAHELARHANCDLIVVLDTIEIHHGNVAKVAAVTAAVGAVAAGTLTAGLAGLAVAGGAIAASAVGYSASAPTTRDRASPETKRPKGIVVPGRLGPVVTLRSVQAVIGVLIGGVISPVTTIVFDAWRAKRDRQHLVETEYLPRVSELGAAHDAIGKLHDRGVSHVRDRLNAGARSQQGRAQSTRRRPPSRAAHRPAAQ